MCSQYWFTYIVRCADGSLYTGVADDIERAVKELNGGVGSAYVRARVPVFLAYTEEYMNEKDALKRAAAIKRLGREGKERLLVAPNFAVAEFGYAA